MEVYCGHYYHVNNETGPCIIPDVASIRQFVNRVHPDIASTAYRNYAASLAA
jgi:hypothetical protein